jgi:hypothetical protein
MTEVEVQTEPVIVADPVIQGEVIAVGTATSSHIESLGRALEQAGVDAVLECLSRGITDAGSILAAKMKAMEKVRAEFEGA